jgi:xanthine dehydrogenase YagR molybdenum-binding subunit
MPEIETILVANDELSSNPLGTEGIGKLPIMRVAAAVADAVFHATGIRVRDLPLGVERLE